MMFRLLFVVLFFVAPVSTLKCYSCSDECYDQNTCQCNEIRDVTDNQYYCIIIRETVGDTNTINIKSEPRNTTDFYIYEPYLLLVSETISFDQINKTWSTKSNKIAYACQTDACNSAQLTRKLPVNGLSLNLPIDWLNQYFRPEAMTNATSCHQCPDKQICSDPNGLVNLTLCPTEACQTTCLISNLYRFSETREFCYQSFCLDQRDSALPSKIDLTAIYYINKNKLEIVLAELMCNNDDCTTLSVFSDIKEKLKFDTKAIENFLSQNRSTRLGTSSMIVLFFFYQFLVQLIN